MTQSAANILADYLISEGIGNEGGQTPVAIWVSLEQEEPAESITVYDTGGEAPDTKEANVYRKTIQVRVRSDDYLSGYARQELIRNKLLGVNPISAIIRAFMLSDITAIGRDDKERFLFTANYMFLIKGV